MDKISKIFFDKKILVYGLGKSGISTFHFLKKKNKVFLFDDNNKIKTTTQIKKKLLTVKKVFQTRFDFIILSPGIDRNKCKLKKFLIRNKKLIYTDLDVFYSFYRNDCITLTGTNGKSTTCKLLYNILKDQKKDVKLAGNIGIPILSVKKIFPKTIFIIEASSYQLDYCKIFNSKYGAILNLSPDHIERHGNLKNYISAKFKLLKNQKKDSVGFVNKHDQLIQKKLKQNNFKNKIININTNLNNNILKNVKNKYFLSKSNQANLSFALEIAKHFRVKKKELFKTVNNFYGLDYRQQIIFDKKNLTIINDSKSTSYSSSVEILKMYKNIYWLLGGIPKKADKFLLSKKYFHNIKCYIYGKNFNKFTKDLKNKIELSRFKNLKRALSAILKEIDNKKLTKNTILFSPASASFDSFKNFEERGLYFNELIKKYLNERKIF